MYPDNGNTALEHALPCSELFLPFIFLEKPNASRSKIEIFALSILFSGLVFDGSINGRFDVDTYSG